MTRSSAAHRGCEPRASPRKGLTRIRNLLLVLLPFLPAWATPSRAEFSTFEPGSARAQVLQDTIDSAVPPDGVTGPAPTVPDTLEVTADMVSASPDSLAAEEFVSRNLPSRPMLVRATWSTGIWEWDREALTNSRALTVLELLEEITGVIPLRGGDHGQPATATAFGGGAGRIRVYFDGIEIPPLDGGVVDLSRIGLAGLGRVRVERRPGELRVELFPFQFSDSRPYSFLEVGTGDLDTNVFRGVFAHPNALGGNIVVSLDRIDTQGPQRLETGTSAGLQVRHAVFLGEKLGLAWEFRRMTSRRPEGIWEPSSVQRTDWGMRGHYEWAPWLQVGAFLQRSSLGAETSDNTGSIEESLVNREPRTQLGAHLSIVRGDWWVDADTRQQGGPGWPSSGQMIRGGGTLVGVGGAIASVESQSWEDGQRGVTVHGRIWTRPLFGLSLFGEAQNGSLGIPFWVPPEMAQDFHGGSGASQEIPPVGVLFSQRMGIRAGLEYRREEVFVGAALLSIESDSLRPVGLPTDRGGLPTVGGSRNGFELAADLPLGRAMSGLSLSGSTQFWDQNETWRYLPERIYQARLSSHNVFLDSENLELWIDLGVRGRDPMQVPPEVQGSLRAVPFQQSWFGRLQVRVSSIRLFLLWDNFTLREANQDYPGRVLPQTRAMYGIRWTLWN